MQYATIGVSGVLFVDYISLSWDFSSPFTFFPLLFQVVVRKRIIAATPHAIPPMLQGLLTPGAKMRNKPTKPRKQASMSSVRRIFEALFEARTVEIPKVEQIE